MSFEKYNQIFNSQKEGVLLKPMGDAKTFDFKLEVKPNTRYRLFTTGNAKQYYCWDTLEDYPALYKDITDSLNTENAVSSQYCLDFSSKECGAWSVAIISIVPSFIPSINARRSSSLLIGGFILNRPSSKRSISLKIR